jgi:hypothetical protein
MNRFRLLPLILCLALCAPIPATAGVLSNHKPIAAAKAHNGSLFLLTEDGIVLAVNLSQTAASIEGRFRLQQPGFASDMILGRYNSNDALFVVSTWSASATSVQGNARKIFQGAISFEVEKRRAGSPFFDRLTG